MTDLMIIFVLTVGCCGVVGVIGLAALRLLRLRSLRWQLAVAALMPLTAVALSVAVNVEMMFISGHDSNVVVLALATSVVLAIGGAWLIMRRIVRGSNQLGSGVSALVADSTGSGQPDPEDAAPSHGLPPELEHVRRELAEARTTLAESRQRERNAEHARQELIGFMSHDLRTPLAGLRALTEGLEDGVITDVPRALGQMRSTVGRMTGLVEDLFELSRVQSLPTEVARGAAQGPVSITELVGDVTDELDPTARAAGVALRAEVPSDDRLAVSGDGDALARALANLVSNAIRHTEPGGRVQVAARRAGDGRLQVSVADGCGGIPDDHLARVFDTGWRGTSARTQPASSEPQGAGLGLAITKGVISAHDGSIGVRNVDGGCCFELDLPAGVGSNEALT